GAEVPAGMADRFDQVGAQLVGDRAQLGFIETAQVGGTVDPREARIAPRVDREGGAGQRRGHPRIFAPVGVGGKATATAPAAPFISCAARTGPPWPVPPAPAARPARIRRSRWPGWH